MTGQREMMMVITDFNVPFSNFSAISAQLPVFFVLSMINSIGMRRTGPGPLQ